MYKMSAYNSQNAGRVQCRSHASGSALGVDGFLELPPERVGKRRQHGIADLPVLALDVAGEPVAVREALHT